MASCGGPHSYGRETGMPQPCPHSTTAHSHNNSRTRMYCGGFFLMAFISIMRRFGAICEHAGNAAADALLSSPDVGARRPANGARTQVGTLGLPAAQARKAHSCQSMPQAQGGGQHRANHGCRRGGVGRGARRVMLWVSIPRNAPTTRHAPARGPPVVRAGAHERGAPCARGGSPCT